jgi:hypothetical protein
MKFPGLAIFLGMIASQSASAVALELAPGSWEVTSLLRNFSISADGQHEITSGGGGPNIERTCVKKSTLEIGSLYPGLKNPSMAALCKATTISDTSDLIDSVVECSAHDGLGPLIDHTVVTASTQKSYATILDRTFLEPTSDGSISRSTIYTRGRWLKDSCDR